MRKTKSGKRKPRKQFTPKESRLVQAFANGAESKKQAAIVAGYSPKNATQSANQALAAIKLKAPEIMDKLGLTTECLIAKHLTPLLSAKETKAQLHEGEWKTLEMEDNTTRRYATRMALELQNAFPAADPALAAQMGVSVVVLDIPRPDRSAINVTPQSVTVSQAAPGEPVRDPRPQQ